MAELISDILWRAANEYLSTTGNIVGNLSPYSCDAIDDAVGWSHSRSKGTLSFVRSLGVNTRSSEQFLEFKQGVERQGARYAWLMFASMYAKELGI
jgi:hypothetical protein